MRQTNPTRRDLIAEVLDPSRVKAAEREDHEFTQFRDRLRVPTGVDALSLYLTWRTDAGDPPRLLGRRLARLNLAARLQGLAPWTGAPAVRRYLRGLHRQQAIGQELQRADPLYLELVHVLVGSVMELTLEQLRDIAVVLVSVEVHKPATALARIAWSDIHWTRNGVRIDLPVRVGREWRMGLESTSIPSRDSELCPVAALHRLWERSPRDEALVFGNGRPADAKRVRRALHAHTVAGGDLNRTLNLLAPSATQIRDRALLLLGYGAALRTYEAISLRVSDVSVCPEGLLVAVPGRDLVVCLPVDPGMPTDPVTAWATWVQLVRNHGLQDSSAAFPLVHGPTITNQALGQIGLNRLIQGRARKARLDGSYSFTSLRSGMIRTAIRRDEHAHIIATHTDLKALHSLRRHTLRETILTKSIAGQVGL